MCVRVVVSALYLEKREGWYSSKDQSVVKAARIPWSCSCLITVEMFSLVNYLEKGTHGEGPMGGAFEPVLARLTAFFIAYDPWVRWYSNKGNGGVLWKDASKSQFQIVLEFRVQDVSCKRKNGCFTFCADIMSDQGVREKDVAKSEEMLCENWWSRETSIPTPARKFLRDPSLYAIESDECATFQHGWGW